MALRQVKMYLDQVSYDSRSMEEVDLSSDLSEIPQEIEESDSLNSATAYLIKNNSLSQGGLI